MTDIHDALEKEYCPPLDPALFSAIVSDFDLATSDGQQDARDILDSIRQSAQEQADTGFDPSGTGGASAVLATDDKAATSTHAESCPGVFDNRTDTTDVTSLSNDLGSLDVRSDDIVDAQERVVDSDFEGASEVDKVALLQQMFPNMKEHAILFLLQKCQGNIGRTMDELLNHAFFESGELADGTEVLRVPTKGIEAFSEDHARRRVKGKKRSKWNGSALDSAARRTSSLPSSPTRGATNSWQSNAQDIETIARCTQLSNATVTSAFHKNGGSAQRSIAYLLDAPLPSEHPNARLAEDDAVLQASAYELGRDFPSVPPSRLASIARLTHPSSSSAHELTILFTFRKDVGGIEIIPRYNAPPVAVDHTLENDWTTMASPTKPSTPSTPRSANPLNMAAAHSALSDRAFTQASAAYRRGRSDKLMSGAAAYYSQIGRDHAQAAIEARGQAADDLVNAQSSAGYVDLHGVNVRDAVRIARQKAQGWWRSGAGKGQMGMDGRVTREDSGGILEIVTGVGRHSVGGRGVVGPAVGRMLVNEGWNVRFEEGVVLVTGKRR